MKELLLAICTTISLMCAPTVALAAETQKVCVDKLGKDGKPVLGKDGKPVQVCREMKIHKKLEGTPVPDKK